MSSRFRDLVVSFSPRIEGAESRSSAGEARVYDVVLYGREGGTSTASELQHLRFGQRRTLEGLDVIAVETARISPSRMTEAFGAYVEGEKAPGILRSILQPDGSIFDRLRNEARDPSRRVWLHFEARELEELPWELLAWNGQQDSTRTMFFRGAPSRLGPLFEIAEGEPPRTLFVCAGDRAMRVGQDLALPSGGEARPATVNAVADARQFDVVHVIAHAKVGPALESALLFHDALVPATELARTLFGSRVGLLGFSPPPGDDNDRARSEELETYRAFMHLGQESFQSSIVAPVGPLGPRGAGFWRHFHEVLRAVGSVERALREARSRLGPVPVPVCFFLRHRTSRVFVRRSRPERAAVPATGSLAAHHAILEQTLAGLKEIDTRFGSESSTGEGFAHAKSLIRGLEARFDESSDEEGDE